jgi:hypothetical protein
MLARRGAGASKRKAFAGAGVREGSFSRAWLMEWVLRPTLAGTQVGCTLRCMAQSSEQLEQLVRELAQLDSVDRSRVVARAARLRMRTESASKLTIPILRGGNKWIGGDVDREAIYGDDGR